MKIGILTLPLYSNYGGILQAYALQTILERMGHEVYVISKTRRKIVKPIIWKRPLVYGKRVIKKIFIDNNTIIFKEKKSKLEYPIINQYMNEFIEKYIHSFYIERLSDIKATDFDAIVVGSDQIWRPAYFQHMWSKELADAFLGFSKGWNITRIAYAASFGEDNWLFPLAHTSHYSQLIQAFDGVSVRETSGILLSSQFLGVEVKQVLDPTMLLKKEDYENLIKAVNPTLNEGNLLCYILDPTPEKTGLIDRVSRERGLKVFHVKAKDACCTMNIEERIHPSVETWLSGFCNAEFVITDSFHACVFSILFEKPFIAIGNVSRGLSRFTSLLEQFNLKTHLLIKVSDYNPVFSYNIESDTEKKLSALRKDSIQFLNQLVLHKK